MRHIDEAVSELEAAVASMGAAAEAIYAKSYRAFRDRDPALCDQVRQDDLQLDHHEVEVHERCINILGLLEPKAVDLRLVTASLRLSNDLERVGDHAKNIAQCARRLIGHSAAERWLDFERLYELSREMLHHAMVSYLHRDPALAEKVLAAESKVDDEEERLIQQTLSILDQHAKLGAQAVDTILVAKNMERVADLATNIAEDLIFIVQAQDIRHRSRFERMGHPPRM
jgi:phosphate transport system protein